MQARSNKCLNTLHALTKQVVEENNDIKQVVRTMGLPLDKEAEVLDLLEHQDINCEALGVLTANDLTTIGMTLGLAGRLIVCSTNYLRYACMSRSFLRAQPNPKE